VGPGNSIGYLGLAPFDKTKLTINGKNVNFMKTLVEKKNIK
jgi:hypothetical protein